MIISRQRRRPRATAHASAACDPSAFQKRTPSSEAKDQMTPPEGLLHLKAGGFTLPPMLTGKAVLRPDCARAFGVIMISDHRSRNLQAILDSADVTAIRTAATAAVAARALGAPNHATAAVVGAGPVRRSIVKALPPGLGALRPWSRDRLRAEELAVSAALSVPHRVFATLAEAVVPPPSSPARHLTAPALTFPRSVET
ncbi:hypothetical protein [Streptomyces sp. NPDC006355]|uniref:hypothetical protein n=1 Tax=Streptomyces sp. NPDC006355 TaxID=3156758 RepID=UPI0033AC2E68